MCSIEGGVMVEVSPKPAGNGTAPVSIPLPILTFKGSRLEYSFKPAADITAFEVSEVWRLFIIAPQVSPEMFDRLFAGVSSGTRGHFAVQKKSPIVIPTTHPKPLVP
jgi:hypothetical protein